MSKARAVGIDLGTTYAAIALVDELGRSAMFRDPQGQLLVPSMVFFEDDELAFGGAAKQAAQAQPGRTAECVKRDLGHSAYSRAIDGELLPAEVIEACLLKKLADDVSAHAGLKPAVVLSMPACFNQAQRSALLDAARIAGLDVLGTITDTLAAALAFAELQGYVGRGAAPDKPASRVLVFDLGGGMLDVAIIEVKPGRLRTLSVRGDAQLGGRDWDLRLADHLGRQFEVKFGQDPRYDMASVRRLLQAAEEAKHTLSTRQQARVLVERSSDSAEVTVTRQAFEEQTADLLARARGVAEKVLAQSGLEWRDLSQMLLVGGATRMPMVGKVLESLTGLKVVPNLHSDEAVARGAALYGEHLLAARENRAAGSLEIVDLTARNLGVEWSEPGSPRAENVVIIRAGTEMPCGTTSKVSTNADDQQTVAVALLDGESRAADECTRIGTIVISGLPAGLTRNWPIDVHYQYSRDGRLHAEARLQNAEAPLTVEWRREGALEENQLAEWKTVVAGTPGLRAIRAQLARHASRNPVQALPPHSFPSTSMPIEQFPIEHDGGDYNGPRHQGHAISDDQVLAQQAETVRVMRKNRASPRNLAIILTGYVVSSVLGLAIGYYILMSIRPEFNYWHLRLPGLTVGNTK